jgi:MTH538 TIR-like domain (DUF1863).
MAKYFNRKDFDSIQLKGMGKTTGAVVFNDAEGKQQEYDVFISHSTKDKELVKKIRQLLEEKYNLSAYIDWEEDAGTKRDDVADKVKAAMDISKSFMFVKTSNSDESQWTAWETGRYDAKNHDKIGVLLVEDDSFREADWKHREFLKDYIILEVEDIVPFVKNGSKKVIEAKKKAIELNEASSNKSIHFNTATGVLGTIEQGKGTSTKFYGDTES